MPRIRSEALVPGALTLVVVVALVSVAQPTSALDTVVTAPDEVTKHDPVELTVVVDSTAEETAAVESYTVTVTPEGEDESLRINFDRDGDVLSIDPPRGTVGNGDIRVNRLRNDLVIDAEESSGDTGYGYGYGYGYGDGDSTVTFDVVVPSSAFKHGEYTVNASANSAHGTRLGVSADEGFTVPTPAGNDPPDDEDRVGRPGGGHRGGFVEWLFGGFGRHDGGGSFVARIWLVVRAFVGGL